jgi:perosamine synthetase
MVTTNDEKLAEKMNAMRNHGAGISEEQRHHGPRPYILPDFNLLGFNYRMTDLQGAVGLVQIEKLSNFIKTRNRWAEFYNQELVGIEWLRTPFVPSEQGHGWQSYVCFVDETIAPMSRNKLMEFLQMQGISTRPGTHAVHMLDLYKEKLGCKPDDFPGAKACDQYSMAIPLHNRMSEEDYLYIVNKFKSLK